MTKDEYITLLESLGFFCRNKTGEDLPVAEAYRAGRTLRHRTVILPNIYFDGSFIVRTEDYRSFPAKYWEYRHPATEPEHMVLDVRPGFERAAFVDLIGFSPLQEQGGNRLLEANRRTKSRETRPVSGY